MSGGLAKLPSERIELILRPILWYTFDGRPLRGLKDSESGKNKKLSYRKETVRLLHIAWVTSNT